MFDKLIKMIGNTPGKKQNVLSIEELAQFLNTSPKAFEAFENAYKTAENEDGATKNFFECSKKDIDKNYKSNTIMPNTKAEQEIMAENIIYRIVQELLNQTEMWSYDREKIQCSYQNENKTHVNPVTSEEIANLPEHLRPQLTGSLMRVDIKQPSSLVIFYNLKRFQETGDIAYYHRFRQGLDILDLDPITYETLSCNKNSMSNWLPGLVNANTGNDFFKIPSTKIIKVPMTLLQLTHLPYSLIASSSTTTKILNDFVFKAFGLDTARDYFVKTGTYSSKFDFRNAHVHGEKEVKELGEYLAFIHSQALEMASPLNTPSIYGVSTTNEWVVREFIKDKENSPCIYHGLPLHTEFRVFVDFNTQKVLSIENYWKPEVMEKRFAEKRGSGIDDTHDAVTYAMNKERLVSSYEKHKNLVMKKIAQLLPGLSLYLDGQWSIDIMLNGDDFWIIDMALAEESAYYESVPEEKRIKSNTSWIPKLPETL